jgi:RNA ligase
MQLLTRDQFRESVFARDKQTCCVCSSPAQDAHHILERRLFPDGGYYLDNGASLCAEHHLQAERTTLSCSDIREKANITNVVLPPHLYRDQEYDKWGNPILPNGTRLKGDLFFDESVQKALSDGGVLTLFTNHVKFPRTYHLPWSPGLTKDDRQMPGEDPFRGHRVVATVKMDGENTTIYRDGIHARSLVYEPHPSRNWPKVLAGRISHDIPEGWRICGENLWAEHSISYQNLEDYFLVFSIWNEKNVCMSWEDTQEWATLLGLKMVPTIYEGLGDRHHIEQLYSPTYKGDPCEGYVVRLKEAFPYSAYRTAVGKYVRANHVVTHGHWMRQMVKPNKLAGEK